MLADRLRLVPGLRYDQHSEFGSDCRTPDLEPEHISSFDGGIQHEVSRALRTEMNVFHNDMTDLIQLVISPQRDHFDWVNVADARSTGLELVANGQAASWLGYYANYAYTVSEDRATGNPLASAEKRLDFLRRIDPDLVVLMPHGRLTLGRADEAIAWLRERNIPMLTPVSVFQNHDDWVTDQQGMAGSMLTMSVVLPELDGGVAPYAVAAQFTDADGYEIFDALPERLDTFCDLVERWLALKAKPNRDKRVAIYYYKGPGKNAMNAGSMEVAPSLLNLLRSLRDAGYTVDGLPETDDEFWELVQAKGPVLGPYARGARGRLDGGADGHRSDRLRPRPHGLGQGCGRRGRPGGRGVLRTPLPAARAARLCGVAGQMAGAVLSDLVADDNLRHAHAWREAARRPSDDDIIRGFISMGAGTRNRPDATVSEARAGELQDRPCSHGRAIPGAPSAWTTSTSSWAG